MEKVTDYKVKGTVLYAFMPREVDHHSSLQMRDRITEARVSSPVTSLVFDFSKTDFMDSAGIGMLLGR